MKISDDILTISDLKQNTSKLIKKVQETKRPLIFTVNGRPAVVLQDVASYEVMVAEHEYEQTKIAITEALHDFEDRKNWPEQNEAFTTFKTKNGIS